MDAGDDATLSRAIPLTIASLAPSPAQINNRSLHRSVFLASSPIHNIRQQEVNAALRAAIAMAGGKKCSGRMQRLLL